MLKKTHTQKNDFSLQALLIKELSEQRKDIAEEAGRMRLSPGEPLFGGNPSLAEAEARGWSGRDWPETVSRQEPEQRKKALR